MADLAEIVPRLGLCRRVVIVGGPKYGKSTLGAALAARLEAPLRSTDSIETDDWSGRSDTAAGWIREPGPQVVEGVAAIRALRKIVKAGERPDVVVVKLTRPLADLNPPQAAMAKGHETVWREVAPELRRLGVLVVEA